MPVDRRLTPSDVPPLASRYPPRPDPWGRTREHPSRTPPPAPHRRPPAGHRLLAGLGHRPPSTAATTPASATASASVSATASAAPTEAATTAAPTPSATPSSAPAPSRDSLRNATLQVPDGCRASEPITFSDGTYQSENGTSYLDIAMKDAGDAVVTVDGAQARAVAFACAAGDDAGGAVGLHDADLHLVGQHALRPLGAGVTDPVLASAVPSTEMSWYPVVLASGSTPHGLHVTWTAYGQVAENDTAFPAGATLDDLEADLTWSGSTVTASPPSSTPRSARSPTSSTSCTPARRPRAATPPASTSSPTSASSPADRSGPPGPSGQDPVRAS